MKSILFILSVAVLSAYAQECSPDQFLCEESGTCIPGSRHCDGFADCLGGSDEVNCPSTTTTPCPGMVCPISGECIPEHWICDGWDDCGDYSDEEGCPCDGFTCPSGKCIPDSWVCDGDNDCGDMADEQGCATTSTTPCPGYVCPGTGRCIPESYICDGDNDCGDWSDESEEACPCEPDEIRCNKPPGSEVPGACIPPEFICDPDGIWDCPDGSDEANCTMSANIFNPNAPHFRPETVRAAQKHQAQKAHHANNPGKQSFLVRMGKH